MGEEGEGVGWGCSGVVLSPSRSSGTKFVFFDGGINANSHVSLVGPPGVKGLPQTLRALLPLCSGALLSTTLWGPAWGGEKLLSRGREGCI